MWYMTAANIGLEYNFTLHDSIHHTTFQHKWTPENQIQPENSNTEIKENA